MARARVKVVLPAISNKPNGYGLLLDAKNINKIGCSKEKGNY
jgi:hypothetical protein